MSPVSEYFPIHVWDFDGRKLSALIWLVKPQIHGRQV